MLLSTSSPSSFLLHHAARAAHSTHHATKHATKASQCMSVAVDVREAARRSRKWIFVLEDTAHGRSTKGRYARGPTALSRRQERKTSEARPARNLLLGCGMEIFAFAARASVWCSGDVGRKKLIPSYREHPPPRANPKEGESQGGK